MVFSSLLFIYIFLPLNLLFYSVFSDIRKKNICLLVFSLIFYAWASPWYLLILAAMALVGYICARIIDGCREKRMAAVVLAADIAVSLGVLGYFKYLGLFGRMLAHFGVFTDFPEIVLPVGISFYTFQMISYTADVYRGDAKAEKNYANVLLYAALFHQCIAGPIVRYKDIEQSLKNRKTSISDMSVGITRFCIGLAKKALLANACAAVLEQVLPPDAGIIANASVLAAWMGGLLYMLQIYLDFSAYSDMAIGLGRMMGFCYKENFRYPYAALTVTDFWRRWHISLGEFFRDYVYIPLGGNRKGIWRQLFNMLVVWMLTGLWHGASANFVMWGIYFFVLLAAEKLFLRRLWKWLPKHLSAAVSWAYTITAVYFGWILFRYEDMGMACSAVKSMFGMQGNAFSNMETVTLLLNNITFIAVCIAASAPLAKWAAAALKRKAEEGQKICLLLYNTLNIAIPAVLLLLSTAALIGNSYNPFIYFRF